MSLSQFYNYQFYLDSFHLVCLVISISILHTFADKGLHQSHVRVLCFKSSYHILDKLNGVVALGQTMA